MDKFFALFIFYDIIVITLPRLEAETKYMPQFEDDNLNEPSLNDDKAGFGTVGGDDDDDDLDDDGLADDGDAKEEDVEDEEEDGDTM